MSFSQKFGANNETQNLEQTLNRVEGCVL